MGNSAAGPAKGRAAARGEETLFPGGRPRHFYQRHLENTAAAVAGRSESFEQGVARGTPAEFCRRGAVFWIERRGEAKSAGNTFRQRTTAGGRDAPVAATPAQRATRPVPEIHRPAG